MSNPIEKHHGKPGAPGKLLDRAAANEVSAALKKAYPSLTHYADSACAVPNGVVAAARNGEQRLLLVAGKAAGFHGEAADGVQVCRADANHMKALREHCPHLRPVLTGKTPSVGLGDRLGLATPGHIAAGKDSGFILVLSQQSIREMKRTERTAQQVMDEATFGVLESGYGKPWGSDADHLKTEADVQVTAHAGFTFFTIDPSEHVDDTVAKASKEELEMKFMGLPAAGVPEASGWKARYVGKTFKAGKTTVTFDEPTLLKAAVKYGRAVAHAAKMAQYIARNTPQYELELSVDETALPTSVAEHLFIAHELAERHVKLISLAPRFVGDFEKGIDYKGDLKAFEESLKQHTEIAKHYGPYKISVHSGSDKFKIYPIVARVTEGLFHLKTAGTSYLEALRVVVRKDVPMFREIVAFCRKRFDTDKATYHISSALEKVPEASDLKDKDLERVYLDEDDGRQILHVTFGSVLTSKDDSGNPIFRGRLLALLNKEAGTYVEVLKKHIGRHVDGLKAK